MVEHFDRPVRKETEASKEGPGKELWCFPVQGACGSPAPSRLLQSLLPRTCVGRLPMSLGHGTCP